MASPPPSSAPLAGTRPASPAAPAATIPTDETAVAASPVLDDGRDSPDLPLTMTASTVLLSLPRDAAAALAAAGAFPQEKVVLRFKPVGSAPSPARPLVKVASAQKFDSVVAYLRRMLRVGDAESVFLYVNSTFAPALEEVVGNLWRCFKDSNNQLNISYSITPAFG